MTKACADCKTIKPLDEFPRRAASKDGKARLCKPCASASTKDWARRNPDKVKQRTRIYRETHREHRRAYARAYYASHPEDPAYRKAQREKLKREVMAHYCGGEPKCGCCGITGLHFLNIDHIKNNGGVERREKDQGSGERFYRLLRKLGFPSEYRVLCWNCNHARHLNGGECPHVA